MDGNGYSNYWYSYEASSKEKYEELKKLVIDKHVFYLRYFRYLQINITNLTPETLKFSKFVINH